MRVTHFYLFFSLRRTIFLTFLTCRTGTAYPAVKTTSLKWPYNYEKNIGGAASGAQGAVLHHHGGAGDSRAFYSQLP